MRQWLPQRRIARSLVTLILFGLVDVIAPSAQAAVLTAPTITGITPGNGTLTVNMSIAGNPGKFWTYNVTRRVTSGCANPYGDGVNTNTASLSTTIPLTGLTNGCTYIVRVASNLDGVGNFAEIDGMPSNYGNFLDLVWANDAGSGVSGINRTPITSGCHSETVTTLNYTIPGSTRPGGTCNTSFFTGYYSGYIRAPFTGSITFKMTSVDDSAVMALQGNTILTAQNNTTSVTVSMISGQVYRFELWFHNDSVGAVNTVTWNYNGSGDISIPSSALANDPSVLAADGGCSLGMAPRCAAGSALEIKQATGTNIDGQYWINIGGTPTLVYCIMNSSQGGGGWMLAMRGKNNQSTFKYTSSLWVNNTLTGTTSYPERYSSTDSFRNADAKYAPFTSVNSNQLMVLFPDYTNAGGRYSATNKSPILNANYGFSWAETYTTTGSSIAPWTAYNATTGWGGSSWNVAQPNGPAEKTNDPTSTPSCVSGPTSLTNLFLNANRCAFRRVGSTYAVDSSSSYPYSAIGDGLFYTQSNIGFFGINYAGASTGSQRYRARIGFGWNENGNGDEGSNDGTAGIGLDNANQTTQAAGTHNQCCYTQLGTGTGTNIHMAFEVYVRNTQSANVSGLSTVRVTVGRTTSTTLSQSYSQSVTTGTATYRLSPLRPGFSLDPSTGTLRVSAGLSPGTYFETVTATDGNGASGALGVTINVLADSSETDTALSFNGTSQFESPDQTWTNTGDFTISMWVKPGSSCSAGGNQTALLFVNTLFFCRSGIWYASINTSGTTWAESRITSVRANEWVHLALTRSTNTLRAYVNNVNVSAQTSSTWSQSWTQSSFVSTAGKIYLGGTGSAGQYFNGEIDEVKVFNISRSASTIWTNANVQESVNNINLLAYYDFNEASGSAINRAQGATSASDINLSDANSPARSSIISVTPDGPYTDVTVPRSIITSAGGWKAPDSVTAITVNIVGGGGGGGGGYQGGGGGGGGFIERTVSVAPKSIYPIQVGVGGRGLFSPGSGPVMLPTNGETSSAFGFSAAGGGAGGVEIYAANFYQEESAKSGGSGGGGNWGSFFNGGSGIAGQGNAGGNSKRLENGYNGCTSNNYVGAGGGGAGSAGTDATCSKGGNGGAGKVAIVTGTYLAGGGGGSHRSATTTAEQGVGGLGGGGSSAYIYGTESDTLGGASSGTANTGGGGGAGLHPMGTSGYGGNGGLGVVTFRYITAFKPTYTPPTNAYLNVGMTETFTTNVAQDSATAVLTRTFRWESSTTGSNGTFSVIKQGTGANNAFFSWVPLDTATSGSNFLFRVIVTDSDTAGLFIQDTSTPVFAVINPALRLVSQSTISKTVGVSRMETFTVSLGTPTYRYSLSPDHAFFWVDTATSTTPRIRIADTATVGTYFETFTVTDSVSASISIPLTIVISPPPSFSASSPQVDSGTVLYLDAGNSSSYAGSGATWNDISGRGLSADLAWSSGTTAINANGVTRTATSALNNITCVSPAFDRDVNGSLIFNGSSTCGYVRGIGHQPTYTYELWIKRNGGQTNNAGVVANPNRLSGDQMNWILTFNSNNQIIAGIYNGTTFFNTAPVYIPNLEWTHIAVSYDASTLALYVNGLLSASVSASVTWNPAIIDYGLLIGRKYNDNQTYDGALASLRFYSRALTVDEIQQNYNATRNRFTGVVNENVVAKKYASRFVDTYTVTAGSESITATFTNNALAGVRWDTSTARSIVLTLQDTLTPGVYYDTITATDIYGSSSRLPITFNISRADTLTVFIDTPTALSYTGNRAIFTPTLRVNGLVGLESGTATSATVRFKPNGATCATGGYCRVGDIGPGGGVVFIDTSTARGDGRIWEVAPANWSGSDDLITASPYCSNNNSTIGATLIAVGGGETNTNLAKASCLGGAVGRVNTFNQSNSTGYSDWFIPNANEASELIKVADQAGLVFTGANWSGGSWGYWTSTESTTTTMISIGGPGNGSSVWNVSALVNKSESSRNFVRPVRAFRSCWAIDTCTALLSSDTPTVGGTYHIVPSALTLGAGSINNYVAINYLPTDLTINRVAPPAINIPWINSNYPDTFTVNFPITSTSGNFRLTTTNGTATGCALDYRKIYTTSQGTCSITITRAATRNFTADTATATIFFLTFVNSMPTGQVGSGSTIALNGATSLETSTVAPPSITSLSTTSISLSGGGTLIITGTGFSGSITVKFWRNKTLSKTSGDTVTISVSASELQSIGATSGRISVITAAGQAVSVDSLTITP